MWAMVGLVQPTTRDHEVVLSIPPHNHPFAVLQWARVNQGECGGVRPGRGGREEGRTKASSSVSDAHRQADMASARETAEDGTVNILRPVGCSDNHNPAHRVRREAIPECHELRAPQNTRWKTCEGCACQLPREANKPTVSLGGKDSLGGVVGRAEGKYTRCLPAP